MAEKEMRHIMTWPNARDAEDNLVRRLNFNSLVAIFFFVFAVVLFLLIPYQIAKPKLMMGAA
jgi:hypothetical protein